MRSRDSAGGAVTTTPHKLDVSPLLGDWLNTDQGASGGILRLSLTENAGQLRLRAFGTGKAAPRDWGEVATTIYGMDESSTAAWSFLADYDFGFLSTTISAYHKLGILVITTYNVFDDDSERNDYWTREFFHRREERS